MKFSEIPGNSALKDSLRKYVDSGRVPHALLISGPAGSGKMLTARAFAQYLHCDNRTGGEPCGVCRSCRLHADLTHPDLHFVFPVPSGKSGHTPVSEDYMQEWKEMLRRYPAMPAERWLELSQAGNSQPIIRVAEAEQIVRADGFPAMTGHYKVFIIWLPERMNAETANSLLKVIEEPSDGTTFIFVSNNDLQILPTIFSRVQRLHAGPIAEEEMAAYLRSRFGASPDRAYTLAHIASGSLIRAFEFGEDTGENDEFRQIYEKVMRAAYAIKPGALKQYADTVGGYGREKALRWLDYLAGQVRENFIYNLNRHALNVMTPEEEAFSSRFAPFINYHNVEAFCEEIDRAKTDVTRNCNAKVVVYDFFLILIRLLRSKAAAG